MSKYKLLAEAIGVSYSKVQILQGIKKENDKRKEDKSSNYNYWASLARALHIKYKVFSLGLIKQSIFDASKDSDEATAENEHNDYVGERCNKYIRLSLTKDPQSLKGDMLNLYHEVEEKKHVLAWLEHRRWNAFTRIMGYQHVDVDTVFNVKGSHKDMELGLHSCLVEARLPSLNDDDTFIYAEFTAEGLVDDASMFSSYDQKPLDKLDLVSQYRKEHSEQKNDFKKNDYYRYEYNGYDDLTLLIEQKKENDYV